MLNLLILIFCILYSYFLFAGFRCEYFQLFGTWKNISSYIPSLGSSENGIDFGARFYCFRGTIFFLWMSASNFRIFSFLLYCVSNSIETCGYKKPCRYYGCYDWVRFLVDFSLRHIFRSTDLIFFIFFSFAVSLHTRNCVVVSRLHPHCQLPISKRKNKFIASSPF